MIPREYGPIPLADLFDFIRVTSIIATSPLSGQPVVEELVKEALVPVTSEAYPISYLIFSNKGFIALLESIKIRTLDTKNVRCAEISHGFLGWIGESAVITDAHFPPTDIGIPRRCIPDGTDLYNVSVNAEGKLGALKAYKLI